MYPDDYKWHFDYVRLAWDAGFSFDKYKYPNLDKNKICLVDIERIIKERDVASVERFLPTVIQYMLENDQAELLDTNFVKMFRISQLSVEYLLFCKKYLDNTVVLLKKEITKLKEENKELKLCAEELEGHISKLMKESFVSAFKCDKCPKVFSSEEYLHSHIKRRHITDNKSSTSPETDQLHSEIKQLKERLNITEKLLQEKEEKEQNLKLDVNEDENKLKVNEILERFEKFKEKVENDLKMLQIEKNFYEEKYSKLFEVVLESSKKENINASEPVNKVPAVTVGEIPVQVAVDTIETTTQTEKEIIPFQIDLVHENISEIKDFDKNSNGSQTQINIEDTIEQKISQFEEQLEIKISSGLSNIEKQMQAFWGKLSEMELKNDTKEKEMEIVEEIVDVLPSKPKIKPRMKFTNQSKLVSANEENVGKKRTGIEKINREPETSVVLIKTVPERSNIKISDVMYDSTSESETKSGAEEGNEAENRKVLILPKKTYMNKLSAVTKRTNDVTSPKKSDSTKVDSEALREDINNEINSKLQDIGISPNWKGIPQNTFEKALEIVQHQANLSKKLYPDYDTIKKSIESSLNYNKSAKKQTKNPSNFIKEGQANKMNFKHRKKSKVKSQAETKTIVTIKNRSLYNTDSDSDDLQFQKSPTRVAEAVPPYSAVIRELKTSQVKVVDTDSDVNYVVLPMDNTSNELHAKSALKSYPSMGSLKKKKVLFDVENDGLQIQTLDGEEVRGGSMTSIDSSDVIEEVEDKKKQKRNSSLSDFDLSEL